MELFKRALAILAASLFLVLGAGTAARADVVQNCYSGAICFYDSSVSAGPFAEWDWADTTLNHCYALSSSVTGWIRNRSSHQYRVYHGTTCGGSSALIYGNSAGAMNSEWNNAITSFKRIN
jgi:hypothetical protein